MEGGNDRAYTWRNNVTQFYNEQQLVAFNT